MSAAFAASIFLAAQVPVAGSLVYKVESNGFEEALVARARAAVAEEVARSPLGEPVAIDEIEQLAAKHGKCADESCPEKLRRALGARLLMTVKLGQLGKKALVSVKLIDTRTASTVAMDAGTGPAEPEAVLAQVRRRVRATVDSPKATALPDRVEPAPQAAAKVVATAAPLPQLPRSEVVTVVVTVAPDPSLPEKEPQEVAEAIVAEVKQVAGFDAVLPGDPREASAKRGIRVDVRTLGADALCTIALLERPSGDRLVSRLVSTTAGQLAAAIVPDVKSLLADPKARARGPEPVAEASVLAETPAEPRARAALRLYAAGGRYLAVAPDWSEVYAGEAGALFRWQPAKACVGGEPCDLVPEGLPDLVPVRVTLGADAQVACGTAAVGYKAVAEGKARPVLEKARFVAAAMQKRKEDVTLQAEDGTLFYVDVDERGDRSKARVFRGKPDSLERLATLGFSEDDDTRERRWKTPQGTLRYVWHEKTGGWSTAEKVVPLKVVRGDDLTRRVQAMDGAPSLCAR